MRGLNFGLTSAPTLFSRVPRLAIQLLRRVLGIATTYFYDDFCTVNPEFACPRPDASSQSCLRETMKMFGLPLAPEKHVTAGRSFIFLGVRTDFEGIPSTGTLTIGVTGERCDSIADAAEHALVAGRLSTADAARLTGRLAFATRWAAGC
jgi:hypothetical protein